MMPRYEATLIVTPDNTAPGSEGRLCLQLPDRMEFVVGREYRWYGRFSMNGSVEFIATESVGGPVSDLKGVGTFTKRRQFWWKNGVRDHGIREPWHCLVFVHGESRFTVNLDHITGGYKPKLPPYQQTLF